MISRAGLGFGRLCAGLAGLISTALPAPRPNRGRRRQMRARRRRRKSSPTRTFTNGQILRDDALVYVAGDYAITDDLKAHLQVYHHDDKGDGNNWIAGYLHPGHGDPRRRSSGPDPRHALHHQPQWRARQPGLGWIGFNHVQAGFWLEENISSAARYIWTNVTGPFNLGAVPGGPAQHGPVGAEDLLEHAAILHPGHRVAAR